MHQVQQCWVIGLPDKALLERIRDYWKHSLYADRVHLRVFSQMDTLRHYVGLQTDVQLLIVDPEWKEEVHADLFEGGDGTSITVVEMDEAGSFWHEACVKESTASYRVTPYQPLSKLFEQLWGLGLSIAKISEDPMKDKQDAARTPIWTISSGGGGAGKTTIAAHLVQYASERGLRTFYWNMDWIHEWGHEAQSPRAHQADSQAYEGSFSKLIYWLSRKETLEAIPPDPYILPMEELRADTFDSNIRRSEWNELDHEAVTSILNWLSGLERYDLIVLDTSSNHLLAEAAVLVSDQVIWVLTDDCSQIRKSERCWKKWGNHTEGRSIAGRMQIVVNRYMGAWMNSFTRESSVQAYLPYIPQWKQRQRMDQGGSSEVFQAAFRAWIQSAAHWMHTGTPSLG
ncbi:nucleotide-binding protein [Paenibacillus aquistagni]|uniref:nucleotide-binding protein n=1 Tax=Paenibacillus aquistagni TaxID=1852522 RepID=UPI000B4FE0E2|nr:hypothetical protein [Paenibacillus aquistagni]